MNRSSSFSLRAVILAFCLFNGAAFAQEDFLYSEGKKIPLTLSTEKICIKFKGSIAQAQIDSLILNESALSKIERLQPVAAQGFCTIQLKSFANVKQLVQRLRKRPEVDLVSPVYLSGNLEAVPFGHFVVKFKPAATRVAIDALNNKHHVQIVNVSTAAPNLYTLRVTPASDLSILDMANLYYESLPCEWSVPDFIIPIELLGTPNDTYFQNQYYFHNTGQTGGVNDADIDAPEAWDITTGSASITVAVIDEGGVVHEDLPSSRIVAGYDFVLPFDNDPSSGGNQAHGMACAGIVAASRNNNLGISGLAPSCKVMNIRIFDDKGNGTSVNNVAAAVDFAWQNGAHVLSNSWGYNISDPNDPFIVQIRDAINRALTQGRNGKGCVVVAAAGNSANRNFNPPNYSYTIFPANVPGVLAVGATDKSNNIQFYSPRDSEMAVVAPSGDLGYFQSFPICNGQSHVKIEIRGDVWSLDISGEPGYNTGQYGICPPTNYTERVFPFPFIAGDPYPPGNYTAHFGGTSAACPQVAGLAALILSVNSNLDGKSTNPQVQNIIKQTADDMGPSGYDTDFGYGRINAYKALLLALAWANKSISVNATVFNNQRKMVYEGTTYHMVFESGSEIYYTYSNDNGNTWSNGLFISDGNGGNKYPSIDIANGIVIVVWQQEFPSTGKICLRRKTASGWQAQQEVVSFFASAGFTATPVVIASGTFDYHIIWHDYSSNNLSIRTYNESTGWKTNATAIPSTNSNSLYPALTRDTYDFAHLAWAESGTIYYTKIQFNGSSYTFSPSKENVSSGTGYSGHGYPSITTDYTRRPNVAWQATSGAGPIIHRRRESSGAWSSAQVFSGSDVYNTPSITGYPNVTNDNNLAIVWRRDPTTIRLAKYVNSAWSQYLESVTGYDPNLSANFTGSEAAKIVLRSGSASPYTITTTSQNLPKTTATRIAHYRRGVMQLGKVELAFDAGDFLLQAGGSKISLDLFAYNDTLVVGHTGGWNDMFRTAPIIWPANNSLEFQNGFSVVNPNLIGGVLPPGAAVIFTLEAVNAATNTPRTNLYQQVVNSANILPFNGKRQIAAPASLAGQSIYLRVAVQTQGAIVAEPSLVEIYHETPDSSGLSKPELADGAGLPKAFTLYPNYPNPFNPETVIRFYLPEASEIELTVFNIVGEIVKTLVSGRRAAGNHAEIWDGRNERDEPVASGVYFLLMRAGNFKAVQKMVLTR